MLKIGCCIHMNADPDDPTGSRYIPLLKELGYDYAEIPLAQTMDLTDGEFNRLCALLKDSALPCRTCNNFFPAGVRITGEEADAGRIEAYLDRAMARVEKLGARYIVFGSSGAKNVPEGFDPARAYAQIVEALRLIDRYATRYGVQIAIETINYTEGNIIRTLPEGVGLMKAVGGQNIRMLVDYFHFHMEKEPMDDLKNAGPYLVHAHFAEMEGRSIPVRPLPEYKEFFGALKETGYDGGVSIEAFSKTARQDLAFAINVMANYR